MDKIEFDDNKVDQTIDINKALERLRKEKKKGDEETKMEKVPDEPQNKEVDDEIQDFGNDVEIED